MLLPSDARDGRIALELLEWQLVQTTDLLTAIATSVSAFEAAGAPRFGQGLAAKYSASASASCLDDLLSDGRHAIVLARALLEIAELRDRDSPRSGPR